MLRQVFCFLFVGLLLPAGVSAQNISLVLTDDTFIHPDRPENNFGARGAMQVGDSRNKQALIKFDAGPIIGVPIEGATLRLPISLVGSPGELSVYSVTSDWNENTVTWDSRPSTSLSARATEIVDFPHEGDFISLDVRSVVETWAGLSQPNNGLLIATTGDTFVKISTKENSSGISAELEVFPQSPGPISSTSPRVLELLTKPTVIDEPGYYILERSWQAELNGGEVYLSIEAPSVKLDMRGFTISGEYGPGGQVVVGNGNNIEIRNGYISGEENVALNIHGHSIVLENLRISAAGQGTAGQVVGDGTVLRHVNAGEDLFVTGNRSVIEMSEFFGLHGGLEINGDDNRIIDSTFHNGYTGDLALSISGNGNFVSGYRVVVSNGDGMGIAGDSNVIRDGYLESRTLNPGEALTVNGSGNILKDNLINVAAGYSQFRIGIEFIKDGNFYGDNQARALVPFELYGTVQTDWGGNAGF